MGWARLVWRVLRLALHIATGVALTLLICRRDRKTGTYRHNPYVISWWHDRLLRILHVEVEVVGHRPQAPALLVSNHVSWLDVPVIGALTHTNFLSKDEVRAWPIVGWLAATTGTLFIRRGSGQATGITQAIADRLAADGLLTLFPEGTTTDGSDVRPFFSRLFGAAIETGTQVVPVGLRYHIDGRLDPLAPFIGDQTLVHNLLGVLKRRHTQVRVSFREPIDITGLDRKGAAETARRAIREAIANPVPADAQARPAAAPFSCA
ncbi:MAG: hypothetical protein RLZ44_305 [Pseudomonadota bacterium]